jgi:hypothetical protein
MRHLALALVLAMTACGDGASGPEPPALTRELLTGVWIFEDIVISDSTWHSDDETRTRVWDVTTCPEDRSGNGYASLRIDPEEEYERPTGSGHGEFHGYFYCGDKSSEPWSVFYYIGSLGANGTGATVSFTGYEGATNVPGTQKIRFEGELQRGDTNRLSGTFRWITSTSCGDFSCDPASLEVHIGGTFKAWKLF